MQNTQLPQGAPRRFATLLGLALGALGFLMSFALAVLMLLRQGNPGFLLIWLAAFFVAAASMRAHAKWRHAFERMYAPDAIRVYYPARRDWRHDVEDVAFRDVADAW